MCSQVECFQDLPMHHLHHLCSTTLGSVHNIWKVSCSHRCGWKSLAGLLDREHRLIRDDLRVEQIVSVVSLISREDCTGDGQSIGDQGGEVDRRDFAGIAIGEDHG